MKNSFLLFLTFFLIQITTPAQNNSREYSLMFYNVENLFDTVDDPKTADEEFTPGGDRHWTYKRLNNKLINLSKTILSASGWEPPEMIAMCEVENQVVLKMLLEKTPLKSIPYKIIHKESNDDRGIDVAFLYNARLFYPLAYRYYPLKSNDGSTVKTREILYVAGILNQQDTIHIFVNHWPSRYSGLLETQDKRDLAAKTLRSLYDELFQNYHNPKVIIVGDFNDQPSDKSISAGLKAMNAEGEIRKEGLYNLSETWMGNSTGTLKYQSQWFIFDQLLVSGNMLQKSGGIYTAPGFATVVQLPFLFERDKKYGGMKPFRTYTGFKYTGGFSDHLPVLLKLKTTY